MSDLEMEGEVLAEEDAGMEEATGPVRALPTPYEGAGEPRSSLPAVLRPEVRNAVVAAAGGVLAGAATVAAVRAIGAGSGSRSRSVGRRSRGRRADRREVVASRSFLVDVHLLGR